MSKPPRSQEVSIQSNRSLNSHLSLINNLLFTLDKAPKSQIAILKKKLKNAFGQGGNNINRKTSDSSSQAESINKVFNQILLEAHPSAIFLDTNPAKLFEKIKNEGENIKPWTGEIARESLLFNKDLVIGIEYKVPGFAINYRLDFDEDKHLHLNMSFIIDNETYLFTLTNIQVKEGTRFYVPPTTHDNYNKDITNQSREIQERMIKFKFSIKMTSYCLLNNCHPTHSSTNVFVSNLKYLGLNYKDFLIGLKTQDSRTKFINDMMQLYADRAEGKIKKISRFFLPLNTCSLPQNNIDSETKSDSEDSFNSPRNN